MKIERSSSRTVWVDLFSPTREEIRSLLEERKIPVHFIDELVSPSPRPLALAEDGVLYTVLHFPVSHRESNKNLEIDFVVGSNFVVTAHYEMVPALEHFGKIMEVELIKNHGHFSADGPFLFAAILSHLYESAYDELETVGSAVRDAEENIFAGQEKKMVLKLSLLSRIMLNFRKTLDVHERILHHMTELTEKTFGTAYKSYILSSYEKLKSSLKSESEILKELQDTNAALLSTKQNEIMKTLTVLASLVLPMSFIAAALTVPAKFTPILGAQNDFWIILAIMFVVALVLFIFMKVRKWI